MELARRELTAALVDRSPVGSEPFGTYVLAADDPAAELGRAVERDVFGEFFGNTPELLAHEYDPYEQASIFMVVVDHRRLVPAGVMRFIAPSPAGQKSLDDIERVWGVHHTELWARTGAPLVADHVWDIATLAVAQEYRGRGSEGLISLALYQAAFQTSMPCDARWFVAVLDAVVLDLIDTRLGRPFSHYDGVEPRSYLDSPASLPVYVDIHDYGRRLRTTDPTMHALLFDGAGIEAAVRPPDWEAAAAAAFAAAAGSAVREIG